jgi:hypothetical protein
VTSCPNPPQDESREQIGFVRRPMVRWFDPVQLAGTALQVVVSSLFGAYSDKREIQAALSPGAQANREYAEAEELWIDYVADLGDGFEPTYSVAYLHSRPRLALRGPDGRSWDTERGRLLVMGGDQVYPTATRTEYEDRLIGPYRAALPCVEPESAAPHLYAIPGNHDWYDGLTNFMRIFCQRHWIGGWKTQQQRSYFALELPHRWWLWAIDIQFDAYIDDPQLDYFRAAKKLLREGDRLVLLTGKPSWTKALEDDPSYRNLAFFEKEMLADTGARLALVVSGDLHHYVRYEDRSGVRQRITAGGGGAYLYPTHHVAEDLRLQEGDSTFEYDLKAAFPPKERSRRLRWWAPWRLPLKNWRLLRVFALIFFALALLMQVPVRRAIRPSGEVDAGAMPGLWLDLVTSRWFVFAALILLGALVLFAAGRSLLQKVPLGAAHAVPQLLMLSWAVVFSAWLLALPGDWSMRFPLLVAALTALVASLPGAWLLGLYLAVCDWVFGTHRPLFGDPLDRHANEAFACQGIADWKNFLRLHIGPEGTLTIFPVGVERVARRKELRLNTTGAPGDPFFLAPESLEARLIEPEPIRIA